MIEKIKDFIEVKKEMKIYERVYFIFAIEECLKYKDTNFEGFLIDKQNYELKYKILMKLNNQKFSVQFKNENITLLDEKIQPAIRQLQSLIELLNDEKSFIEHLNTSLHKFSSTKYYLDSISLEEFKSSYLNGHAYSLYEKIILDMNLNQEKINMDKKPFKI